jgi:hypothetical protein
MAMICDSFLINMLGGFLQTLQFKDTLLIQSFYGIKRPRLTKQCQVGRKKRVICSLAKPAAATISYLNSHIYRHMWLGAAHDRQSLSASYSYHMGYMEA